MNVRVVTKMPWRLCQLNRHDRWTRQRLEAYQARLREHAYARSSFYQRFHKGLADCPLHELPVLTKATMINTSTSS